MFTPVVPGETCACVIPANALAATRAGLDAPLCPTARRLRVSSFHPESLGMRILFSLSLRGVRRVIVSNLKESHLKVCSMASGSRSEKNKQHLKTAARCSCFFVVFVRAVGQRGFVSEPFIFSFSSSSRLSMACPWLG